VSCHGDRVNFVNHLADGSAHARAGSVAHRIRTVIVAAVQAFTFGPATSVVNARSTIGSEMTAG